MFSGVKRRVHWEQMGESVSFSFFFFTKDAIPSKGFLDLSKNVHYGTKRDFQLF